MKKRVMAAMLSTACAGSHALQSFEGKVTLVEPTYLPAVVSFIMDAGNASCPAGGWLKWANSDSGNNKAVYATLLMAFAAGKTVRLYMNDGDTSCTGVFMHVFN